MNTLIVLLLYNVFENVEQNILDDENNIAIILIQIWATRFPHSKLNQEKSYQEICRQLIKRNFMVEFIKTGDYWVLMDLMCRQGAVPGFNILPRHSSLFWVATPLHGYWLRTSRMLCWPQWACTTTDLVTTSDMMTKYKIQKHQPQQHGHWSVQTGTG